MRRVEQAKEGRSIYWHVPAKETPPDALSHTANTRRQTRILRVEIMTQSPAER